APADARHLRAGPELPLHAFEGGDPGRRQVGVVIRAEEALGADEERGVVLVPADTLAGAEGGGDLGLVLEEGGQDLEAALSEGRALLVGEDHGLLGVEAKARRRGIVVDVAARGLRAEPLADVALGRARTRGELGRSGGGGPPRALGRARA